MANPAVAPLYWEDLQTMVTTILNGQSVDPTLLTQMLSESRTAIEQEREWNVLRTYDTSLQWSTSDTFQTAHSLGTLTVPFGRWRQELPVQVWDGNTSNPTVLPMTLIDFDQQLWNYSSQFTVAVDYSTMNIYFMGTAGQLWKVVLSYIGDYGDIVQKAANGNVATTWAQFPARFHKFLAYDVAARWRLGVSYDDLAARNADDNGKQAERIKQTMCKWDSNISRTLIRQRDYMSPNYPYFVQHKIMGYPN